jgi:hypothetical protein
VPVRQFPAGHGDEALGLANTFSPRPLKAQSVAASSRDQAANTL